MAAAWNMPVDFDPPDLAVVLDADTLTYEYVMKSGECVVNVPTLPILENMYAAGTIHGRNIRKFEVVGLTAGRSRHVKAPYVKECSAHIECRLLDRPLLRKRGIALLRSLATWYDPRAFNGVWRVDRRLGQTLHHLARNEFGVLSRSQKTSGREKNRSTSNS
jgi:flavin reductase (DIM6/NTAB) family NADH-FMN oxidoreductase RutF